ncbi:ImmA/IrrE family metallo-endopeptidase [Pseudomonas palleroniana]|uniref:ImmA/IrrE family metallo-endopeptidase n=1 Tax=Pseudomonas palleroniana TaxID=191390 RepID=UPI0018E6CBA3|nr:ImmA/IrrE family metallo-endopeptidase [Pseudomonas palleroniana]MBI6910605.1 ImmA/IrrE family metallo-endopeptidase [Pseudomonas palleroniana]
MAFIRKNVKPKLLASSDVSSESCAAETFTVAQLLDLAKRKGVETSPLDVQKLLSVLGVELLSVPMKDEVSGMLSRLDNREGWVVRVNALHHPNRQRFTIAHEIGHYCRHRWQQSEFQDQNFFRNGDSNPMEAEANRFASELLMPEQMFKEKVRLFTGSIEAIAQYFKVSTLAVRVRAKNLGMKGHGLE